MRIENGKWVDQYGDPVTVFSYAVSLLTHNAYEFPL